MTLSTFHLHIQSRLAPISRIHILRKFEHAALAHLSTPLLNLVVELDNLATT